MVEKEATRGIFYFLLRIFLAIDIVVAEKLMQTESTTSHHQSPIGGEDVIAWFRKESCLNNICLNGGQCFVKETNHSTIAKSKSSEDAEFECLCSIGFVGDICEIECPLKCQNGGHCKQLFNISNPHTPKFYCECLHGFSGENCAINSDCSTSGCRDSSQICLYDGKAKTYNCESNFCAIQEDLCKNNATCRPIRNNFVCECHEGFGGQFCDETLPSSTSSSSVSEDKCQTPPIPKCFNGGQCEKTNNGSTFVCICPPKFEGSFCEAPKFMETTQIPLILPTPPPLEFDACSDVKFECKNGGKCLSVGNLTHCICPSKFGGRFCELTDERHEGFPLCRVKGRSCQNGGKCVIIRNNKSDSGNNSTVVGKSEKNVTPIFKTECKCDEFWEGTWCELPTLIKQARNNASNEHGGNKAVNNTSSTQSSILNITEENITDKIQNATQENTVGERNQHTTTTLSGQHTDETQTCLNERCKNGGICIRLMNGSSDYCNCTYGYRGKLCEHQDYCSNSPCQNGGTCQSLDADFKCNCPFGYLGRYCEKSVESCSNSNTMCANGGRCIDQEIGFTCDCRETGYKGAQCESDIDECQMDSHCMHGMCKNLPGSYLCTCKPNYIGKRCNIVNPCIKGPNNQTYHNCAHGNCVRPIVIVQTNGREVAQHECDCNRGYTGPQCTLLVQEHYHLKIAGLIGLAASFVFICVALCFVLYLLVICTRKKRATQGKYSPSTQEMVSTRLNNQRPYQGKTSQGGSSQSYRKRNI